MSARPAGTYARERHRSGLRRYRRRMRPYFLGLLALALALLGALAVSRGVDRWSLAVGASAGALITMALWLRDEPPELVAKWGRGADGERRTSTELAPLLNEGWKVRHDVKLDYG